MKILLIDPDEYYHSQFQEIISPYDELLISRDVASARSVLVKSMPDVLIMELLLPDRAGYELLQEIRSQEKAGKPSVIIFSSLENLEDIKGALNYGIVGYFVKGRDSINDVKNLLLTLNI